MSQADLTAIHDRMKQEIARAGGQIDGIYWCPHTWDEGCECRKPKPGLLYQAQRDLHLDLTRTPFIGDDERDAAAAAAAGCPFYRVTNARSLLQITQQLLEQKGMPACVTTGGF
jgi:D-glycero-D-manno-heptose 1,7-bisphosphate phosphatase